MTNQKHLNVEVLVSIEEEADIHVKGFIDVSRKPFLLQLENDDEDQTKLYALIDKITEQEEDLDTSIEVKRGNIKVNAIYDAEVDGIYVSEKNMHRLVKGV